MSSGYAAINLRTEPYTKLDPWEDEIFNGKSTKVTIPAVLVLTNSSTVKHNDLVQALKRASKWIQDRLFDKKSPDMGAILGKWYFAGSKPDEFEPLPNWILRILLVDAWCDVRRMMTGKLRLSHPDRKAARGAPEQGPEHESEQESEQEPEAESLD